MSLNDATSDDTDATVEENFKREDETSETDHAPGHVAEHVPTVNGSTERENESPLADHTSRETPDPSLSTGVRAAVKRKPPPKPKNRQVTKKKQKVSQVKEFKLPPGAPPLDTSYQPEDEDEELFCVCRRPDDGKWMIGCDYCDEWIHGSCVGITPARAKLIHKFCCPYCTLKAERMGPKEETTVPHQLTLRHGTETTWKRVCRLEECHKAVSYPNKYCCREHGLEYMKGRIAALAIDSKACVANGATEPFGKLFKERLAAIIKQTSNLEEFKRLGSKCPVEVESLSASPSSIQLNFVERKLKYMALAKERTKSLSEEAATAAGVRKKDICGYDSRLDKGMGIWANELAAQDELVRIAMSDDDKIASPSHEALHNKEHICLQEKRKCYNHLGWVALITDQLNLELAILQRELQRKEGDESDLKEINRLKMVEGSTWI